MMINLDPKIIVMIMLHVLTSLDLKEELSSYFAHTDNSDQAAIISCIIGCQLANEDEFQLVQTRREQ